jgi:hypothetical protein
MRRLQKGFSFLHQLISMGKLAGIEDLPGGESVPWGAEE